MSKKSKRELAKIDALCQSFDDISKKYPDGGYVKTVFALHQQRIAIADKIGRRPK